MRKGILIPLAALVLLAAGYFLLDRFKPFAEKEEDYQSTSKMLFQGESAKVKKLTISRKGEDAFSLLRAEDGYAVEGMKDIEIDSSKIESAFSTIATLYASSLVTEDPKDLKEFGLDAPNRVEALLEDGTRNGLEIGDKSPAGDYYVRKSGEKSVYITSSYNIGEVLCRLYDFRMKEIAGINTQTLSYLRIAKPDEVIELENREIDADRYFASALKIVKPYKFAYPANLDGLNAMLEKIPQSIVVQAFIDKPAALSSYGLEPPRLDLTMKDETSTLRILFGKSAGEGLVYAKIPDKKGLVTLKRSDFDFAFDVTPFSLVGRLPFLLMIDKVDSMEFRVPGKVFSASLSRKALPKEADAKPEDPVQYETSYTMNGKPVEESVFKKIYQAIIGIQIEGKMKKAAPPKGAKAEASLSFTIDGGKEKVFFELVPSDDDFYALRVSGEAEFLITKSQVEDAANTVEKLLSEKSQ